MSRPLHASARPPAASRRRPADQSVSLRQPGAQTTHRPQPLGSTNPPSAASSLINHRDSSGESSNVDTWFENSNNNLLNKRAHTSVVDNEPPFYFHNVASSSQSRHAVSASVNRMDPAGSGSDEYRGVIDDLTIQNKRLRKRLRRYEKANDTQVQQDKLFEVRVHGLPSNKKRDLEELLRNFAQSLGNDATGKPLRLDDTRHHERNLDKSTTSLASTKFADSGYGSMMTPNLSQSASRHDLSGASLAALADRGGLGTRSDAQTKEYNIRSYLHEVPSSLLPKPPIGLSERGKKQLVVRRLEQIFQGCGASVNNNQHSIQQQRVSSVAAKDDAPITESPALISASEGVREAQIMLSANGKGSPDIADPSTKSDQGGLGGTQKSKDPLPTGSPFDAQRPTRPLDLDPARAQDSADNIQYIRHLGFSVPDPSARPSSPADLQGWIYLNLLINMAQLHTINVTPNFVKHAISDYSNEFELSHDGRKVRWRSRSPKPANLVRSVAVSDGDESSTQPASPGALMGRKRKHSFGEGAGHSMTGTATHSEETARGHPRTTSFVYAPLFQRQDESDGDDASMADYESSQSSPELAESAALPGDLQSTRPRRKAERDGPIIFYSNPYFCTDLSGDKGQEDASHVSVERQHSFTSVPIGVELPLKTADVAALEVGMPDLRYFTDSEALAAWGASATDAERPDSVLEFPERSPKRVSFADERASFDFEATGLGGVVPADNITISVVKERRPQLTNRKVSTVTPPQTRLDTLLGRQVSKQQPDDKIISTRTTFLEPSTLPEPSMAYDLFDLTEDEESEESSEADHLDGIARRRGPDRQPGGPTFRNRPPGSPDSTASEATSEGSSIEAENGSQFGGVDFLAMARRADPEGVRVMEREYDAEMAERLAEEIPAGSSAATAGGGSHNPSPMGPVEAVAAASMVYAAANEESSSSNSEDDNGDDCSISS